MAVNLPPQYHEAEARYRQGRTPEDKLAALREMWVLLPKHKASEKLQADLKRRISELTDEAEEAARGPKKASVSHRIPRQGAGQVVLLGPPNAGKSSLLGRLTKASPVVAAYPFTTREPVPGMMEVLDVRVQLVELPPITAEFYEPWMTNLTRGADAAVLVADLADDDGPAALDAVLERLRRARRLLAAPGQVLEADPAAHVLPTLVAANKSDDPAADVRLELLREALNGRFPIRVVSAASGAGLAELRQALFDLLGVMRIYSKQPGKPADRTAPFTLPRGATVAEFAGCVHRDFEDKVRSARVWGSGSFDGQTVGRDHVLADGDVVELHV